MVEKKASKENTENESKWNSYGTIIQKPIKSHKTLLEDLELG